MNIGVIGTGAYGIALAIIAFKNKNKITMWTKFEDEYEMLIKYRKNIKALPDAEIPRGINITLDLKEGIQDQDIIILAIPSNNYTEICKEMNQYIDDKQIICIASKGITSDNRFLSEIVSEYLSNNICVISGPSFAIDLLSKGPIGLSIAGNYQESNKKVEIALTNDELSFDLSEDIIGIQICGTIKNAFAIGSGILNGLGCLDSTSATYLTKCLNELKEFLKAMDCLEETCLTYSGVGDLLLTCNSAKSRNFCFGKLIGKYANKEEIDIFKKTHLIEGLSALTGLYKISKQNHIDIPIINVIYSIVFEKTDPKELLQFIHNKNKFLN